MILNYQLTYIHHIYKKKIVLDRYVVLCKDWLKLYFIPTHISKFKYLYIYMLLYKSNVYYNMGVMYTYSGLNNYTKYKKLFTNYSLVWIHIP